MEKQNFEFENNNSTDKKTGKPLLKRLGGALKIVVVTMLITFVASTFVACDLFNGGRDNPDDPNQGITVPEDPDDPEKPDEPENPDDPENPIDPDDPVIDPDDPIIDPDDPVIDPDDPVIDPDDPENPIDPEDPEQPVDPDDPENPVDPENPDENEPQDITEVDEIDEINKFADEAIQILNNNYLDGIALKVIGNSMTAENIDSAEWIITNSNGNTIGELQVKVYYTLGTSTYFKVGKVEFNENYSVSEILSGKAQNVTYSKIYQNPQILTSNIEANKELGNLVINTVNGTDAQTQNEGDIWCSIGSVFPEAGKEYRPITVYQIDENQVQKYELIVEAPTVHVDEIMQNITDGKIKGQGSCTTEYTFEGQKIEQETGSNV